MWYRLADRLGWPIDLVRQLTTVSQFVEWNKYIDQVESENQRQDYYFAQIALEVWRGANPKHRKKAKLKSFLLDFSQGQRKRMSKTKVLQLAEMSKQHWLGMFPNVKIVKRSEQNNG